jgi:hypothetical protein
MNLINLNTTNPRQLYQLAHYAKNVCIAEFHLNTAADTENDSLAKWHEHRADFWLDMAENSEDIIDVDTQCAIHLLVMQDMRDSGGDYESVVSRYEWMSRHAIQNWITA